jgi:hypothetical protein
VTEPTSESAAFGPRREAVAAVIDRAGRLTPDEVEALTVAELAVDAVVDAAWNAAWNAAWSAGRAAAWHAAGDAVWSASWDTADDARQAAWDTAAYAAVAELVRDLIAPEQYDTLAGSWNSVIGQASS